MSIEKITSEDGLSQSKNLIQENIEQLKKLFPEIVTEDKIDFKSLQQILGEEVEDEEEYYRFTWAGKSQARREAHKPSTGTLRPCKEESLDWDTTQNLYIEGDNLEVLKLLQKSYAGKIKMIYIDPPYNTGKDKEFIYNDDYRDNLRNYQLKTGQIDSEGNINSTNSDKDGRLHSNWLNMIYPRLRLARNLLKDDGILLVSIDNHEFVNLKKVLDEIFGENNFVTIFKWNKTSTPPSLSKKVRHKYEFVLCYEKNYSNEDYRDGVSEGGDMPLLNEGNSIRLLTIPKEKVIFNFDGLFHKGKYDRVTLENDILIKNGESNKDIEISGPFKWTQENLNNEILLGTEFIIKSIKFAVRYIKQGERYKKPSDIISKKECGVGTNEDAGKELKELFGENIMSFPKPTSLTQFFINMIEFEDEIFMDFFAGSSSSACAVINQNLKDKKRRRFIQVQFPEEVELNSKSNHQFNTISDIGKERIRRLVGKIKKEKSNESSGVDLGFKVLKLDSSNIKAWDGLVNNEIGSQYDIVSQIKAFEENIKEDRTDEDILYEILLKYGLDLTLTIEERDIHGRKVFNVGMGSLFICLGDDITSKVAEGIGEWKEECDPEVCRVIFKDNGFTDVEKTNSVQILKRFGINEVRSI